MNYQNLHNATPKPQVANTLENNFICPDFSNYTFSQKISFAYGLIKKKFSP